MSICTMKELVFVICLYCLPELVVLYKILQTLIVEEHTLSISDCWGLIHSFVWTVECISAQDL